LRFCFSFWGPEAVGQTNSKKYENTGEKRYGETKENELRGRKQGGEVLPELLNVSRVA
jgi:hypothetical protein